MYTFYRLKILAIDSDKLIAGKIMYIIMIIACGFRSFICIVSII